MKEGNIITPYKFKKVDREYLFSLTYVGLDDVLPQMRQVRCHTIASFSSPSLMTS